MIWLSRRLRMANQKPKGVDVDFVFAEMNALTELCQQSGMCPA